MGPTPKHRWAYACSKAIDEVLSLPLHARLGDHEVDEIAAAVKEIPCVL